MTVWLTRQEAVAQFSAYLGWIADQKLKAEGNHNGEGAPTDEDEDNNEDNEDNDLIGRENATSTSVPTHAVSTKPGFPRRDLMAITTEFKAPFFLTLLTTFIHRAYPPPLNPVLPNAADHFDLYKVLSVRLPDLPAVGRYDYVDRIRIAPLVKGSFGRSDKAGRFDTVLVSTPEENENEATQGTYLQGTSFSFHISIRNC
jgi:hypothetical protein